MRASSVIPEPMLHWAAEVLERAAGHATSAAYHVPNVDIESKAVYTNNIPCGAMRGFGVNQVTFAMESCVDQLCAQAGFDPWQFRYDNVLDTGKATATGQILGEGVGLKETLLAVKDEFYGAQTRVGLRDKKLRHRQRCAGRMWSLKLKSKSERSYHFTARLDRNGSGRGYRRPADLLRRDRDPRSGTIIEVNVSTESKARAGMTTASRATFQMGHAIMDACQIA